MGTIVKKLSFNTQNMPPWRHPASKTATFALHQSKRDEKHAWIAHQHASLIGFHSSFRLRSVTFVLNFSLVKKKIVNFMKAKLEILAGKLMLASVFDVLRRTTCTYIWVWCGRFVEKQWIIRQSLAAKKRKEWHKRTMSIRENNTSVTSCL